MTDHSPALPERTLSFAFYVDNRKIEWPWSTINGAQVRGMVPDMNPVYRLVLEGVGREDDRPLNDGDSYPLAAPDRGPLRFYSVPPATFGCPAALPERTPAEPLTMDERAAISDLLIETRLPRIQGALRKLVASYNESSRLRAALSRAEADRDKPLARLKQMVEHLVSENARLQSLVDSQKGARP